MMDHLVWYYGSGGWVEVLCFFSVAFVSSSFSLAISPLMIWQAQQACFLRGGGVGTLGVAYGYRVHGIPPNDLGFRCHHNSDLCCPKQTLTRIYKSFLVYCNSGIYTESMLYYILIRN